MKVSIIIPTYNRKELLKRLLDSVFQLDFDKNEYEIIVVDDGSTDRTEELLKEYSQNYQNIKYLKQKHKGASAARNLGIENAKGEIIAFTDSDCIVDKNWIKEIVKSFKENEIIAMAGKVISDTKNITPFTHQIINNGEFFASCNIACKEDAIIKVGKFDERFIYGHEDTDLYFRLKRIGKIVYNHKAIVYHHTIKQNFLQFIKRIEISYRNECLLYNKYPEIYFSRKLLPVIIRKIGIKLFFEGIAKNKHWIYKNIFIFMSYIIGLIFQRIYLTILILRNAYFKKKNI